MSHESVVKYAALEYSPDEIEYVDLAQREQHLLDCSYAKGEMAYILGEQEKLVEQNGGSWEVFMDLWNAEVTERDWDLLELVRCVPNLSRPCADRVGR